MVKNYLVNFFVIYDFGQFLLKIEKKLKISKLIKYDFWSKIKLYDI